MARAAGSCRCSGRRLTPPGEEWFGQMAGLELRVVRRRVWRRLWQEDRIEVVAEPWIGRPLLRVSAQAYTTRDDLERLDRGTPGGAALR